ncbi:Na+/H+ antiporter [Terrarubrum flagellatum]|uniref:Na+/H+ antiporter n=1 Tax=Terrirubrum flagellatum TaxID=2895980 RepID=UPI0031450816
MATFEWIIALLIAAVLLAGLARRLAAPYPTFLAIGGACLAFIPNSPSWTLDPELALALFVAPVLLDAAYDTSLRDLRDNWAPVGGLVFVAVIATTAAVAFVARWLVPDMPWPVAIALGAIVAPPDAAAATAIVRQVKLPHRLVKILEGESLLNDASALLIYRLAILALTTGGLTWAQAGPAFLITVIGSAAAGYALARVTPVLVRLFDDAPSSIIVQFATTFSVWIFAEHVGLSGILTIVVYAMTLSRRIGSRMPARLRVPSYAVWEATVFILNAFAFVLIGLQLRPIWERLDQTLRVEYGAVALSVLATVIVVRLGWVMSYNKAIRMKIARYGFRPRHAMSPPTVQGGIIISWAGMRGIVTLAAAFALPETLPGGGAFPYRDLILLTAFCVVLGTLVIQGLTLKPLIAALKLDDGDPVGREIGWARAEAYRAALAAIDGDETIEAKIVRKEYQALLAAAGDGEDQRAAGELPGDRVRRAVIAAARRHMDELRLKGVIGDDAYHVLEEEFDWAELSAAEGR